MNLLSGVRLGAGMGLIPGVGMYTLNKLLVYTQPAHLAIANGAAPSDPELAIRRAQYVRRVLEEEVGRRGQPPSGTA
jgi:protein-arginine kinase